MKKRSEFTAVSASPWLIYTHGKGKCRKSQTLCTVKPGEKPYVESIPCLSGTFIVGCSRGWLILRSHYNKIIYLWNPDTSDLIKLPPITSPNFTPHTYIFTCILTNNPNNNNNNNGNAPCILLLFCNSIVFSYRLSCDQHTEASNWISQQLKLKGLEATITQAVIDENNTVIYGLCYTNRCNDVVADRRNLVTINVEDGNLITLGLMHLPLPPVPDRSTFPFFNKASHFLIESCGIVYVIVVFWIPKAGFSELVYEYISALQIWMLDIENLRWVEAHSLDDRAFFINYNSKGCVWSWANNEGGVEPNSIYLYKHKDNTVYHYKLRDLSVTLLRPCPDLLQPSDPPSWIVLSHHHQRSSAGDQYSKPQAHIRSNQQHSDHIVDPLDSEKPFDHHKTPDDIISSLPADVIQFIAKRLYLFDYLRFRRACKSLRSNLPLSQCRIHNQYPLFLLSKNKADGSCQIMDPITTDSCFITVPFPSKFERFIDFSKNGWLLFGMRGPSFNYFNISNGVTGSFPTFGRTEKFSSLGFSTSPASSNCLTVGIYRFIRGTVIVSYHRYGENDWTTKGFRDNVFKFEPWTSSPIFVDDAVYFLDQSGHVGVFEFKEDSGEPQMMFYDKPELKTGYFDSNLVECDGQILSVFIENTGKWVQVFKFDKLKKVWVEVKELRDNILFVNHSTSMSAVAPEVGMGNRIYLPRLYKERMVYYSLETRKFHTSGTNYSLNDLCGTEEQLRCSWV